MLEVTDYEPCELHWITNCSTCSGLDKKLAAEERASFEPTGRSMPAMFLGKCPKCGEFIDVGVRIFSTEAGWICCP